MNFELRMSPHGSPIFAQLIVGHSLQSISIDNRTRVDPAEDRWKDVGDIAEGDVVRVYAQIVDEPCWASRDAVMAPEFTCRPWIIKKLTGAAPSNP